MIEKLIKVEGGWECPDGMFWATRADYLFHGALHVCGCCSIDGVGRYIFDMIKRCEPPWLRSYDDYPTMFFRVWATHEGYLEHGTTIRCSWMTEKGRELLRDLEEVLK